MTKMRKARKVQHSPRTYWTVHHYNHTAQELRPAVAEDPEDTFTRGLQAADADEGAEPGPSYINPDMEH